MVPDSGVGAMALVKYVENIKVMTMVGQAVLAKSNEHHLTSGDVMCFMSFFG